MKGAFPPQGSKVVEFGGRYGFASLPLSNERPDLFFEVRSDLLDCLQQGKEQADQKLEHHISFTHTPDLHSDPFCDHDDKDVSVYIFRNVFWNWPDHQVVCLLKRLVPVLKSNAAARILVTDGLSPLPNSYPPHVELAYRRRDITMMAMHNVKQRTNAEWMSLFRSVDSDIQVRCILIIHSYECLSLIL
jgi:hypothetical protein